ncbi:hypothetical protein P4V54_09260 [Brevibacillus nitrificans]|uniref:hypothetical protein n=1 Tax=Brevibacillus nitrificans TaxID=651560 RepID=UPI002E20A8D8|nr:hypothetical protein [Brevibacillus nitrificans]
MEQNELIMEWFLWHRAVEYIKEDLPEVESADMRFPLIAGWVLRRIGSQVYQKEKEAALVLKENRIRIVKEKFDQGVLFVVWSYRGNTDIFRINEGRLRAEVQKKIGDMMKMMTEIR